MPLPLSQAAANADIPPTFNEDYNCGAYLRKKNTLCMNRAGQNTDHLGEGRCYLHGGQTPIRSTGKRSIIRSRRMKSMQELFEEHRSSPDLLRMDNQVAQLKAMIDLRFEMMTESGDTYKRIYEQFMEMAAEEEMTPTQIAEQLKLILPNLDVSMYDALNRLTTAQFNMQFSRKFSVSVQEMASVLERIYDAFIAVCDRHGVPPEAIEDFGRRLKKIQLSRPVDATLEIAGRDRETIIDQEPSRG